MPCAMQFLQFNLHRKFTVNYTESVAWYDIFQEICRNNEVQCFCLCSHFVYLHSGPYCNDIGSVLLHYQKSKQFKCLLK